MPPVARHDGGGTQLTDDRTRRPLPGRESDPDPDEVFVPLGDRLLEADVADLLDSDEELEDEAVISPLEDLPFDASPADVIEQHQLVDGELDIDEERR